MYYEERGCSRFLLQATASREFIQITISERASQYLSFGRTLAAADTGI
jgi:hypothetical protein